MVVSHISCVMIDESNCGLNAFVQNQMTIEQRLILLFFKAALWQLMKAVPSSQWYNIGGTGDNRFQKIDLDYFHFNNYTYLNTHYVNFLLIMIDTVFS